MAGRGILNLWGLLPATPAVEAAKTYISPEQQVLNNSLETLGEISAKKEQPRSILDGIHAYCRAAQEKGFDKKNAQFVQILKDAGFTASYFRYNEAAFGATGKPPGKHPTQDQFDQLTSDQFARAAVENIMATVQQGRVPAPNEISFLLCAHKNKQNREANKNPEAQAGLDALVVKLQENIGQMGPVPMTEWVRDFDAAIQAGKGKIDTQMSRVMGVLKKAGFTIMDDDRLSGFTSPADAARVSVSALMKGLEFSNGSSPDHQPSPFFARAAALAKDDTFAPAPQATMVPREMAPGNRGRA